MIYYRLERSVIRLRMLTRGAELASTEDLETRKMQFAVICPRYSADQNIVAKNFVSKLASAFSVNTFAPVLA